MKNNYQAPYQNEKNPLVLTLTAPGIVAKSIIGIMITLLLLLFLAFQAKGQTLTLLSPNGGETWMNGTTQSIFWQWEGNATEVYIYYSSDDGANWNFIGNAPDTVNTLEIITYLDVGEFSKFKVSSMIDSGITDESDDFFTVLLNPVYFSTPQPGDVFYAGQEATVYWDSFLFNEYDIDFSSDGGITWTQLEENYFLNFYNWTVPDINSSQCIIKITNTNNSSEYGLSPNFSVFEQPTATFTSPAGGDIWTTGEEVTMSWTGTNLPLQVYFDYSLDGGQTWNYFGNAYSGPTAGSVSFTAPRYSSTNAKMRIFDPDNNLVFGMTEEPFTFYTPPVTIYFLEDGQEFYIGGTAVFYWIVNDVDFVNIELSRDGGENWEMILANIEADIYAYTWTASGSPSDNCKIRISDASDPSKFDVSGTFSLLEVPELKLTNPTGNELWKTGSTYAISWTYDNPEFYNLIAEYSIDSGANWTNIGFSLPAQGSVDWKTPNVESEECLVRMYDTNLPFVADTSEAFTLRDYPETSICMVSVDSATNRNVIVWEKADTDLIRNYIIYKETDQMNVFDPIGTVAYDSLPFFVDVNSNPSVKSYRYKLGFDDSAGYVYPMGDLHQTIHLTFSQGVGNTWNLNWGAYLGFDVSSFNIYRSANGASYELIETISSSFFSYTDIDAPDRDIYYFIEVEKENGCDLSTREYQVSSALSNIVTNNFLSVEPLEEPLISNIYPNPSSQWLKVVTGPETGNLELQLFDMSGRMILTDEYKQVGSNFQAQINVADIDDGTYFLRVNIGKVSEMRKVVIKH